MQWMRCDGCDAQAQAVFVANAAVVSAYSAAANAALLSTAVVIAAVAPAALALCGQP